MLENLTNLYSRFSCCFPDWTLTTFACCVLVSLLLNISCTCLKPLCLLPQVIKSLVILSKCLPFLPYILFGSGDRSTLIPLTTLVATSMTRFQYSGTGYRYWSHDIFSQQNNDLIFFIFFTLTYVCT